MNLLDIRKQFVGISGRYDLVIDSEDYEDNGANFYINAGQNILDKLAIVKNSLTSLYLPVVAGDYSANFGTRCLSVEEVWVNDSETRSQLEKVTLNDMKSYYSGLVSTLTPARPTVYCLASLDTIKAVDRNYLGTFLNLKTLTIDTNYRGIIISPVVDNSYVVEVYGYFLSTELTTDEEESYWTINAPELLLKSALQQLYVLTGRQSDALSMSKAIAEETMLQDKCSVEEEIAGVTSMEG